MYIQNLVLSLKKKIKSLKIFEIKSVIICHMLSQCSISCIGTSRYMLHCSLIYHVLHTLYKLTINRLIFLVYSIFKQLFPMIAPGLFKISRGKKYNSLYLLCIEISTRGGKMLAMI